MFSFILLLLLPTYFVLGLNFHSNQSMYQLHPLLTLQPQVAGIHLKHGLHSLSTLVHGQTILPISHSNWAQTQWSSSTVDCIKGQMQYVPFSESKCMGIIQLPMFFYGLCYVFQLLFEHHSRVSHLSYCTTYFLPRILKLISPYLHFR